MRHYSEKKRVRSRTHHKHINLRLEIGGILFVGPTNTTQIEFRSAPSLKFLLLKSSFGNAS